MGVVPGCLGGFTPICNNCGISESWEIEPPEYEEDKQFWEDWRCPECNGEVVGLFNRRRDHATDLNR